MPRVSILLASRGLAFNVQLRSVPSLVAASGALQHVLPGLRRSLGQRIGDLPTASANPRDALIGLIDAETEALQVARVAIENPYTPALGEHADAAGGRVLRAVTVYLRAVQAVLPD